MSIWRQVRDALAADRARHAGRVASADATFLPAALEVIERPVSPTARVTGWLLIVGLAVTVAWLMLGRVDLVASAPGRIIPTGNVKIVASAGTGIVRAIHVHDGDRVRKGQLLVELDTTLSRADLEQARKALLAADLDVARNRAIADALSGRGMRFDAPAGAPPAIVDTQRHLIDAQIGAVDATVSSLSAAQSSALSEAAAASAQEAKLGETVPILDREIVALQRLADKGYASGFRLLELQRQRRGEAGDRDVAAAQQARGMSDGRKFGQQIAEAREEARRVALADLSKAQLDATVRREEVTKAERRSGLQMLVAPESGTVQQLVLHTVGGVVEPARALMVIVPDTGTVEVEARVLNADAGFVREGQRAVVKVEAFPFTRYGTASGRVVSVSRDAVGDPKLGPTYVTRIVLDRPSLNVDGAATPLMPGLSVTADIRTGTRSIMSYLLSPLSASIAQAGRER